MGREIRKVVPNWKHPMKRCEHSPWRGGCDFSKTHDGMCFVPVYNRDFESAAKEWKESFASWERGERPSYCGEGHKSLEFWEYESNPPERERYRPAWTEEEATWFQVYETVSEGTPVTPAFATKEELVEFLCTQKDFWGQGPRSRSVAEAFVRDEYAPSMVVADGKVYPDMDAAALK